MHNIDYQPENVNLSFQSEQVKVINSYCVSDSILWA